MVSDDVSLGLNLNLYIIFTQLLLLSAFRLTEYTVCRCWYVLCANSSFLPLTSLSKTVTVSSVCEL